MRFERLDELKNEAFAVWAASSKPVRFDRNIVEFLSGVASAALVPVQDLYLPFDQVNAIERARGGEAWAIDQIVRLVVEYRQLTFETPAVAQNTAKPNERCPCGSGKKFKRCCMASAA